MTRATWSYLTGERGRNRVRVFEHPVTGRLFLEFRENGQKARVALGHRDRELGKLKADELAARLRRPEQGLPCTLTLSALFDNYLREVTPTKGEHKQAHDRRAARMLLEIIGPARPIAGLTHRDTAGFVAKRRARGDLRAERRKEEQERKWRPLRARQIEYDVKFLQAALNWAVGAGWIDRNPLKGFRVEGEQSPRRPVLTAAQYDAMLAVAAEVEPAFETCLVIAHETGHRVGAVTHLRWSDVDCGQKTVRWQAGHDKRKFEHTTPLTDAALQALAKARRSQATIGDAWVFPSPTDASQPVSRHVLRNWWKRAEALAKLSPEQGRGWHSLRRKFATEMKHAPLKDLCTLGSWKDPQTVLKCYQRPDAVTMRQALEQRTRLEAC